jgi:hypothetical protein
VDEKVYLGWDTDRRNYVSASGWKGLYGADEILAHAREGFVKVASWEKLDRGGVLDLYCEIR